MQLLLVLAVRRCTEDSKIFRVLLLYLIILGLNTCEIQYKCVRYSRTTQIAIEAIASYEWGREAIDSIEERRLLLVSCR